MKADAGTEADVKSALERFGAAYRQRDLQGVLGCIAADPDVVLYGTGADEKRVGRDEIRAQVERDWSQSDSAEMAFGSLAVSAAGAVAWVAAEGAFRFRAGGQEGSIPARASFVLENRGGRWLLVHVHFSTPASGQQQGESF